MADKRIEDFATLEEAQDDDLLLVSSESETYTMKFKTFKELVAGLANAPVANAAPRTQNADFYVASGNNLPTVKVAVAFPYAHPTGKGRQIIFIPSRQNLTATPTLSLNNGQAIPIKTRASSNQGTDDTKPDAAVSIPVGCLMRGVPYLLTFCGKYWLIDSMIGSSSGGGGGSHYTINGQEADLNGDFHLSVEDLPGVQEERLVYSYDEITLTNTIHAIEDTSLPIQVYYDTGEYCSDPEENEYPYQGVAFLRLKSHHLDNNGFMVVIFEDDVELCDQSGVVKKAVRITISPGAHPGDPDVKTVTITDPASSGGGGAPHVHIFTLSDVTTTEIAALTEDTDNALFLAYNVANYTPDPEAATVVYPYENKLLLLPMTGSKLSPLGNYLQATFEQDADLVTYTAETPPVAVTVRKTVRVTVQSGASAGDPDVKTVEIVPTELDRICPEPIATTTNASYSLTVYSFDATKTYHEGDLVLYGNQVTALRRCSVSEHTGAWNASHFPKIDGDSDLFQIADGVDLREYIPAILAGNAKLYFDAKHGSPFILPQACNASVAVANNREYVQVIFQNVLGRTTLVFLTLAFYLDDGEVIARKAECLP